MRAKKILKNLLILIGLFIIGCILAGAIRIAYVRYQTSHQADGLLTGAHPDAEEDYDKYLKETDSDIDGMTMYEKYKKGMDPEVGSDSDMDGLTDKEEIEVYGSDPLKASTAGDLYTDKYKVEHDMDVNKKYDYEGEPEYPYNECSEVHLTASNVVDLYAVVKDVTGYDEPAGYEIYKEYMVYNYSESLSIDVSQLLLDESLTTDDVAVLVNDGKKTKKWKTSLDGTILTLKDKFKEDRTYYVYIINSKKDLICSLLKNSSFDNVSSSTGSSGLVVGCPFLYHFGLGMYVLYEDTGDDAATETCKNAMVNGANSFLSETGTFRDGKNVKKESNAKIAAFYTMLQRYFPSFEVTSQKEFSFRNLIFSYFTSDVITASTGVKVDPKDGKTPTLENETDVVIAKNFTIDEELLFKNFGSSINKDGNCAGISHYTALLFNTGTVDATGSYDIDKIGDTSWDLTFDPENKTLMDRFLADFKGAYFVRDKGKDYVLDDDLLTDGEKQFVNMIGCFWAESNDKVKVNGHVKHGFLSHYDYSLLDVIKKEIDSGKILDACIKLNSGYHTVNIYGYSSDSKNPDVTYLYIYDSNIPGHGTSSLLLNDENVCIMKVTKTKKAFSDDYYMAYSYSPLVGNKYYANSSMMSNCLIVCDENFNILNP